jgi:hypothetical protein
MKIRTPSAVAEPSTVSETHEVLQPAVSPTVDGSTKEPSTEDAPTAGHSQDEPGSRDPRDHDADGRMGGVAPAPEIQHLVVLTEDGDRGLSAGEVLAVSPVDAGPLLMADVARNATAQEVELASPRIRPWTPAA